MSTNEVWYADGAVFYFALVGGLAGVATWLAGGSTIPIVCVVVTIELLTLLVWWALASYPRNIWQLPFLILSVIGALVGATGAYLFRGCKTKFPEWTFKFELAKAAARALRGGSNARNIVQARNARYFRHQIERIGKRSGPKSCKKHGTRMDIVEFNGLEHVWIREEAVEGCDSSTKERFVVLYYHGGGFVLFSPHYFVELGNRVRSATMKILHEQHPSLTNISIECFLANYRKCPEHIYPIPQEDAVLAFEHIVVSENLDPSRIILMGDSAGGGLCLTTMLRLKAKGSALPAGAILSCPFVDFDVEKVADDSNCVLALALGQAMMDAFLPTRSDRSTWGDAAPVYHDLSGLPPVLIQIGSVDTIYLSAVKLYDKAQADGLGETWELDVFPHMPHAFTCLPDRLLPDVTTGIEHIAHFAVRQIARVLYP